MKATHIIKHYKANPDGTLRFVGNETTEVEDRPASPRHSPVIDNETMQKISDIAYNGRINPDDRES